MVYRCVLLLPEIACHGRSSIPPARDETSPRVSLGLVKGMLSDEPPVIQRENLKFYFVCLEMVCGLFWIPNTADFRSGYTFHIAFAVILFGIGLT